MTRGVIGFLISPLWVLFVLWAYSCTVTFPALGLLPLVGALLGLIAAYLGWSSSACRCSGSSSSGDGPRGGWRAPQAFPPGC
jgi:hypothetical protein